jgi:two-component system chemotaxis response regulator CheY
LARVLIVEDDDSLRKLYRIALKLKGHEVIGTASDGNEAVDMFRNFSKKPDIIIMDHRMPGKNGLEATKEIMKMNCKSKVIFASADKSVREEAIALGARSFKPKPFSLEKLCSNIKKAMNSGYIKLKNI